MNILSDEVFAVILAIMVIGSIFSVVEVIQPRIIEPFISLGLLNEECKIGDYPREVFIGENLTLCLLLYNYMGYPVIMQVKYKIGTNETLPTNTTPSPQPVIMVFEKLLDHNENITLLIQVPIAVNKSYVGKEIALIFELWIYDVDHGNWVYSGIWDQLYVKVLEVPIP